MQSQDYPAQAPSQPAQEAIDYEAFLQQHLQQADGTMRYPLAHETLWVKRANQGNPALNYWLLNTLASLFGTPVLRPVPNPGGSATIQTEVRRLRSFQARGLRAPEVLASCEQAFVMRHLGRPGEDSRSLSNTIEDAIPQGAEATLAPWLRGLQALQTVHAKGEVLSQSVARNMVVCADDEIGFVDFEDDPAAHLPRAVCMARDALNYAQSTALFLEQAGALPAAQTHWTAFVQQLPDDTQQVLQRTVKKLGWVRFLPRSKSLGRDTLRVLAAYDLLAAPQKA